MRKLLPLLVLGGLGFTAGKAAQGVEVAPPAPSEVLPVALGVSLLRGEASLTQTLDGEVLDEEKLRLSLLTSAGREAADRKRIRIVAVRAVTSDEGTQATIDRLTLNEDMSVATSAESAFEAEDKRRFTDLYLPGEFLPDFPVPDAGSSRNAEQEVKILGRAAARGSFSIKASEDGDSLTITRELQGGSTPEFDFQGNPAKLASWKESIIIARGKGLVKGYERKLAFAVTSDFGEVTLASSVVCRDPDESSAAALDPAKVEKIRKAFAEVLQAFRKRQGSAGISSSVESLARTAEGTPLSLLAEAMRSRLEGYKAIFEADETGRILARLLDREAPDFVLEDLDGVKRSFRKLTKGKVTLLSFWGYG